MKSIKVITAIFAVVIFFSNTLFAQTLPQDLISVSHTGSNWIIEGEKNKVILNESDLAMKVEAGPVVWSMAPSNDNDVLVKSKGEEFFLRLADAGKTDIQSYDTGYKKGVKIRLSQFLGNGLLYKGLPLDLTLVLTICLENKDEELVCDAVAIEHEDVVRQLDWPKEVETRDVNYTALNHVRGNLLPPDWPEEYHPYGSNVPQGQGQESLAATDKSYIQSNLIECWSMSWWGFQKGKSAMVVIVETPDDAAYKFRHPAGGPTVIGPRWLASLGKLSYPRSVRMCFIPDGNYVNMAKRYRKYVKDIGQFVSLKVKIAREPRVADLIGAAHFSTQILRNYRPGSYRYDPDNKQNNYRLITFEEAEEQLRELKAKGLDNVFVKVSGWPKLGYDRQHPDVLPPAPEAGGWEGLLKWANTCKELGYGYVLHDQYRDYYTDAPSFDPQFAVHEEDNISPPKAFPGTRFGGWKEGYIPMMDYWHGGEMAYLNSRFQLGHVAKTYQAMFDHGIKTQGSMLDVYGYVPPTEDFNPEHPLTRTQAMKYTADVFNWVKNNLGIVGTEDGADWVVPYVDYVTDANLGATIPVPLYELVYHDAILTPEGGLRDPLRCLLYGGFPGVPRGGSPGEKDWEMMRTIMALHKRIALLEMTNHEFLGNSYRKERTTFSDGTTVTIDRDSDTFEIIPALKF
jgi:hypothetical protein